MMAAEPRRAEPDPERMRDALLMLSGALRGLAAGLTASGSSAPELASTLGELAELASGAAGVEFGPPRR